MLASMFIHATTSVGNGYSYSFFSRSMILATSNPEPGSTSNCHRIECVSNEASKDLPQQLAAVALDLTTIGKLRDDAYPPPSLPSPIPMT